MDGWMMDGWIVVLSTDRWEDVVEHEHALRLRKTCQTAPSDQRAVDQLRHNPPGWSQAHYEQLAQLLSKLTTESGDSIANLGDVKQYIDSLSVSSQSVCTNLITAFTAQCYASAVCAVVMCLSVCLSHTGIVSKWLNIGSRK